MLPTHTSMRTSSRAARMGPLRADERWPHRRRWWRNELTHDLPRAGFERHKKVDASNFFRNTLQREGPAAWRASNGAKCLSELGVFDASQFEPTLNGMPGRRPRDSYLIWTVLNLESWVRASVTSRAGVSK